MPRTAKHRLHFAEIPSRQINLVNAVQNASRRRFQRAQRSSHGSRCSAATPANKTQHEFSRITSFPAALHRSTAFTFAGPGWNRMLHPTRETSFFRSTRPTISETPSTVCESGFSTNTGNPREQSPESARRADASELQPRRNSEPSRALPPVAKIQRPELRQQRRPAATHRLQPAQLLNPKFLQVPQMPAADGTPAHHQRLHFFPVRFPGLYSERNSPIHSRSLYSPFRNRSSRIRPSTLNPTFL